MGRLNDQIFDTVISGAVQRLANVVNHFAIAVLDVVKDDLAGKAAAYRVVRECFLHGFLDGADRKPAVVVIAGAEADDQQFVFANIVLIERIVQTGVSGIIVFIGGSLFCLPAGRGFSVGIRVVFRLRLSGSASGQQRSKQGGR